MSRRGRPGGRRGGARVSRAAGVAAAGLAAGFVLPATGGAAISHHLLAVPAGASRLYDEVDVPAGGVSGGAPVAVLVHGGAWGPGRTAWLDAEAGWLAQRGWVAASIDYRTPATRRAATELGDVEAGIRAVRRVAAGLGADPQRTVLLGESAGGTLAALAALTADERIGGPVAAVVSWSGPMDLAALSAGDGAPGWLQADARRFAGCVTSDCAAISAVSPITAVRRDDPPMLLVDSRHEIVPASEARDMADALRACGTPATVVIVPGRRHAIGYAADVWPQTLAFVDQAVGLPDASAPDGTYAGLLVAAFTLALAVSPARRSALRLA